MGVEKVNGFTRTGSRYRIHYKIARLRQQIDNDGSESMHVDSNSQKTNSRATTPNRGPSHRYEPGQGGGRGTANSNDVSGSFRRAKIEVA